MVYCVGVQVMKNRERMKLMKVNFPINHKLSHEATISIKSSVVKINTFLLLLIVTSKDVNFITFSSSNLDLENLKRRELYFHFL